MRKFLNEFKEFASRGNMLDLAIGIILGAAFGKIVSSLVADVLMPPLGVVIGGVSFTDLVIPLNAPEMDEAGKVIKESVNLKIGNFLQAVFDFLIVALAIFLLVKGINRMKKNSEARAKDASPPAPSQQEILLTEIRDLLKNK